MPWRTFKRSSMVFLLLLAACGGARTTAGVQQDFVGPPPSTVLVAIGSAISPASGTDPAPGGSFPLDAELVERLSARVVSTLQARGVPAVKQGDGPPPANALTVEITVLRSDPGSRWQRSVVGFGYGRSSLAATALLRDASRQFLSFDADADSGSEPGTALGLLGLAGGGGIILPAITTGGMTVLRGRHGQEREVDGVADAVLGRLNAYFRRVGWIHWSDAPPTIREMQTNLPPPVPRPRG